MDQQATWYAVSFGAVFLVGLFTGAWLLGGDDKLVVKLEAALRAEHLRAATLARELREAEAALAEARHRLASLPQPGNRRNMHTPREG